MKFLKQFFAVFLLNAAALALMSYIPGVVIESGIRGLALITLIFTALNIFIKPILKVILSPVIILTLGLGLLVVNAIILFVLDLLTEHLTIQGALPLILATLLISAANFVIHVVNKK